MIIHANCALNKKKICKWHFQEKMFNTQVNKQKDLFAEVKRLKALNNSLI